MKNITDLRATLFDTLEAISPGNGNTWTARTFDPSNPDVTVTINDLL